METTKTHIFLLYYTDEHEDRFYTFTSEAKQQKRREELIDEVLFSWDLKREDFETEFDLENHINESNVFIRCEIVELE